MKVLKFGGTSMGDAARMRQVAEIVEKESSCVVVCSAMAGVTNTLTDIAGAWRLGKNEFANELTDKLHQQFHKTCFELFPVFFDASVAQEVVSVHFTDIRNRLLDAYQDVGEKWLLAQGEIITCNIFVEYLNASGSAFGLLDAMNYMRIDAEGEPSVEDIRARISHVYGDLTNGCFVTQGFICLDHQGRPANLQRGGSDYTATLLCCTAGVFD